MDSIKRGIRAEIVSIDWAVLAPDEGKRLRALGIDKGAEVAVAHRGVFGTSDPLAITIGRMTIAIRKVHAAAIRVTEL